MSHEIFMPALSSTMTEGKIVEWLKNPGDKVERGESVLVVESDKADMDVESFQDGYLAAVLMPAGSTAPVGETIGLIVENEDEIASVQEQNKLGNERIFLYMGRIANEKNIEALLRSWRQTKNNNCKLVIVGDGPMKPTLENSFSNLSNEKLIWWGAELDLETRVAIMQIAEVFFLPSLVEGLSLSLLEAMSTGTACVATDAGADGEVLDNGAGIIISTDNVAAQLKTIIPIMVEHPSFTKDLGQKARDRVLERYTITKNINSLEEVYVDLKDNFRN